MTPSTTEAVSPGSSFRIRQHVPTQKNLDNILSANQREHELLQQILRGVPQQETLSHELDLCALIDETLEVFRATLPSTITMEKINRLSTARIRGQSTQLFRMISNLLSNAVQAMRGLNRGLLTIFLDRVQETDPLPFPKRVSSTYLRLMIRDTGRGMSADLCRKMFDPLFTTQQDGKGLGLGLAIVKEVVNDHDGMVTVESYPPYGSTFTVYFPEWQEA